MTSQRERACLVRIIQGRAARSNGEFADPMNSDIHVAFNYGQATGSAQLLRFVTEHTEVNVLPEGSETDIHAYHPDRTPSPVQRLAMLHDRWLHLGTRYGLSNVRHARRVHTDRRIHLLHCRRDCKANGCELHRHKNGRARAPSFTPGLRT